MGKVQNLFKGDISYISISGNYDEMLAYELLETRQIKAAFEAVGHALAGQQYNGQRLQPAVEQVTTREMERAGGLRDLEERRCYAAVEASTAGARDKCDDDEH